MSTEQKFPTEIVELPSKGLLYPKDSPLASGTIEMKYMTAKEEDILTNQNYIEKGVVIDKLLQSLIIDKTIDYNQILVGDKNALLIAARILGYGAEYEFNYGGEKETIDLSSLNNKELNQELFSDGKNEFTYTLPASNTNITFKLLAHGDETKLDAVYSQVHPLKDFVEPSNYKTYDELKSKLMRVLGEDVDEGPMTLKQEIQMNEPEAAPQPKVQESVTAESVTIDDDDETMSYFAKLAAEQ